MKRLKNFVLGLLIVVVVGFLLFMYIQDERITECQDCFLQFEWFQPLLISLATLLILIGLILVFSIFKPIHRKPELYRNFDGDHVYVSREAIEKTASDTIVKYDQVRQSDVAAKLYNRKDKSYVGIKADFFVPSSVQVQSLTEAVCSDIKKNVEYFTGMPVHKLEVNVKDQKTSGLQVL